MITTLTLNPSLDCYLGVQNINPGAVHRAEYEYCTYGGKGINVAVVLHRMGVDVRALMFKAGHTGEWIDREVRGLGVKTACVRVNGFNRINVKILGAETTEFNGVGIAPNAEELRRLTQMIEGEYAVLSGSLPSSLPADAYAEVASSLTASTRVVIDAEGAALRSALACRPYLIKPNREEAEALTGVRAGTREEVFGCAHMLQRMGARNVLISLGAEGACLLSENGERFFADAIRGRAVNAVGAGDSLLAGFLAARTAGADWKESLYAGIAAGCATAFSPRLATAEEIAAVRAKMQE